MITALEPSMPKRSRRVYTAIANLGAYAKRKKQKLDHELLAESEPQINENPTGTSTRPGEAASPSSSVRVGLSTLCTPTLTHNTLILGFNACATASAGRLDFELERRGCRRACYKHDSAALMLGVPHRAREPRAR